MDKNIVVTGIGFLNDWVIGRGNFSSFLSSPVPQTPIEKIDFDTYIDTTLVRRADHVSRCALSAAKLALEDAGLPVHYGEESRRIGIALGTVHGPMHYTIDYHTSLVLEDPRLSSPIFFSDSVPNAAVSNISTALGIRGNTTTLSGYCAVMQALQYGSELVKDGLLDICLVGGADVNHDFLVEAYRTCLGNSEMIGKNFGGSGFLVIESLKHAVQRKAKIYAQLEGVCTVTAAYVLAKRYDISPLKELLRQEGDVLKEHDCILSSSYDEEDSIKRTSMYLKSFRSTKCTILDCSSVFGCTFSAADVFQIILGVLGAYSQENLCSFKELNDLKKQVSRIFVMSTSLAGANACALFSHRSANKE